ncbi:MAG: hypothetical protein H6Q82_1537, partial [Deltaproteobacteria bacterium]|nr:hypothetical protein [Deltaproteobacteria bacterium]
SASRNTGYGRRLLLRLHHRLRLHLRRGDLGPVGIGNIFGSMTGAPQGRWKSTLVKLRFSTRISSGANSLWTCNMINRDTW